MLNQRHGTPQIALLIAAVIAVARFVWIQKHSLTDAAWEQYTDPDSGFPYWVDPATNAATWEQPIAAQRWYLWGINGFLDEILLVFLGILVLVSFSQLFAGGVDLVKKLVDLGFGLFCVFSWVFWVIDVFGSSPWTICLMVFGALHLWCVFFFYCIDHAPHL